MNPNAFRKLATGSVLFNLDRIIAPRIVKVFYLLGLAGILLWAVNHFFYSFRFGFGNGLWGILEIAVFGLLAFVVLRIVCEGIIVFFRAYESESKRATKPSSGTLFDDVREAIEELAEEEPDEHSTKRRNTSRTTSAGTTAPRTPDPKTSTAPQTTGNAGVMADASSEYEVPDLDAPEAQGARKPATLPGENYG